MNWSIAQLAYFAGILDGEGCFYISRITRQNQVTHRSPEYLAKLYVVSTDKELINWLSEIFEGYTFERKGGKSHWRRKYEWGASAKTAIEITKAVFPYLVIKQEHAGVFLRFQETVGHDRTKGRVAKLSDEILSIREWCYQEIKRLNSRNLPVSSF